MYSELAASDELAFIASDLVTRSSWTRCTGTSRFNKPSTLIKVAQIKQQTKKQKTKMKKKTKKQKLTIINIIVQ